jgi:hypothetical protein
MSQPISFQRDVMGLFYKYAADMAQVSINTPEHKLRIPVLNDYQSVKNFHYQIQIALHGYDYDAGSGEWLVPEAQRLPSNGGQPGEWVMSAPHPMPPDGRMPQLGIDLFDQWVRDGMLP